MNTKTQASYGFYTHLLLKNFFSVKARTLIAIAVTFNQLEAGTTPLSNVLMDVDPPVIVITIGACEPAVKDTVSEICYGHIVLTADATDNETPKDDLLFSYRLDLFNDGIGVHSGYDFLVSNLSRREFNSGGIPVIHNNAFADNEFNPFDASGTYPIGIHKICWYVSDTSGNTAALCQLFEIKDCKAPTPYCLTDIVSVPLPASGCITIWAKDLDKGSFDNCTTSDHLRFYFNGDPTATSMTICCQDFVSAGAGAQLMVEAQMWVEDEEGNTDNCKVSIIVTDFFNLCDGGGNSLIYGQIFSIKNRLDTLPVKNVKINQFTVGENYFFNFPGGDYFFEAGKNDEPFEYVSTYDIIRIKDHILGINNFENVYQKIVADVNNSNSITASDASEIRNLILRNQDNFKKSESWFIFPIIDPIPLWPVPYIFISVKNGEQRKINFRGIKMGDVNDLISSDSDSLLIPNPNDSLVFKINNKSFVIGDTVTVDFNSKNLTHILGYQYTIKFDTQYLKFVNMVENNLSTSKNNNFGIRYEENGFVTTSWINPGENFTEHDVLFTIQFIATRDANLCDLISITSDLTPAETYRDSFLIKNIKLNCELVIKTEEETKDLCKIYPNPFQDEIHFHFSESVKFPVDIEIISLEGKNVASHQLKNEISNWTWVGNQLSPGVYLIHIRDSKNNVNLKMIKD